MFITTNIRNAACYVRPKTERYFTVLNHQLRILHLEKIRLELKCYDLKLISSSHDIHVASYT